MGKKGNQNKFKLACRFVTNCSSSSPSSNRSPWLIALQRGTGGEELDVELCIQLWKTCHNYIITEISTLFKFSRWFRLNAHNLAHVMQNAIPDHYEQIWYRRKAQEKARHLIIFSELRLGCGVITGENLVSANQRSTNCLELKIGSTHDTIFIMRISRIKATGFL